MSSCLSRQITTQLVDAALLFAERRGASPERICAAVDYRRHIIGGYGRIEFGLFGNLLHACGEELNDAHFGLHLGGASDFRAVGTISYTMSNAPTIRVALQNLVRFQSSFSRGFGVFFESRNGIAVGFTLDDADHVGMRHMGEMCIAIAINTLRSLINECWVTAGVIFQHQICGSANDYRNVLGCTPDFSGSRTELRVSPLVAQEVIPFADRTILPVIERQLASVASGRNDSSLINEIRMEITRTRCDGTPTVDDVARNLRLSTRTLQRRLGERGTGFRELLCGVRKELAQEYLRIPSMDLLEVSLLLGYSDLSAFDHAFLGWVGESPSSYRKRAVGYSYL